MSGDTGSVGRVSIASNDSQSPVTLDIKGLVFKGNMFHSNSFLVVNIGANECKIESIANHIIRSQCTGNALESMTVLEGSIEEVII